MRSITSFVKKNGAPPILAVLCDDLWPRDWIRLNQYPYMVAGGKVWDKLTKEITAVGDIWDVSTGGAIVAVGEV